MSESILLWKIKNFSFAFEAIDSPEFWFNTDGWRLSIKPRDVECRLVPPDTYNDTRPLHCILSFIPCDGSLPLSAYGSCLKVLKETLFKTRRKSLLPEDTLTVQFRFYQESYPLGIYFHVQSQIGVKRKCWLWTLKYFEPELEGEIEFETIDSEVYGSVDVRLKLGEGVGSDEQFYIELSRKFGEQCFCVISISVLDADAEVVRTENDEFLLEMQDGWMSFPLCDKSALYPIDGVPALILQCDIAISLGKVTDEVDVKSCSKDVSMLPDEWVNYFKLFTKKKSSVSVLDLQNDMKGILGDKIFCDASLKFDSEVFHVHKAILSGRSLVFKALFMKHLTESNFCNIGVEKIEIDTFSQMLYFIYTDTIKYLEVSNINKLYIAANEYQVPSLKKACCTFLIDNFSVSNICEILPLAHTYSDNSLLIWIARFISKNSSKVWASKEWKDLEKHDPDAASRVSELLRSKKLHEMS